MRLVWLIAFVAVAERESFTVAAKSIGKDQGSVSRYVDQLQMWLGKILVEFHTAVRLTPDGKAFLPIARQIIASLNDARHIALPSSEPIDPKSIRIP